MTVNNELEQVWKEVVMAKYEVQFWALAAGTEEDHETPQDSWCPD
jgi:hypothetical protein